VIAVGDEALRLRGQGGGSLSIYNYIREGAIWDPDLAEAAIRYELRSQGKAWLRLPPRIVVATRQNEIAKRSMRDVLLHSGARDVIVLPAFMAGAIGAGLDVEGDRPRTLFMLDRDWAGFAVVSSSAIIATSETAGGIDQMLEDVAARAGNSAGGPDLEALHSHFRKDGIAVNADKGHALFAQRWRARFLQEVKSIQVELRDALKREPLCLLGPYARVPGIQEMFTESWEWQTVVPAAPERAVILRCRQILGKLDELMNQLMKPRR